MNPKVSIILTSYNKPETVGIAIESVLKQTLSSWELYIMDDASNDATKMVIDSYLGDYRIHYYNSHVKNQDRYKKTRYAALINQAIPLTKGKYLSYITDDTVYLPDRLEKMTKFLEDNPLINIVYSGQIVRNVNSNLETVKEYKRKVKGVLKRAANKVDHCSVMHTRTISDQVFHKYGSYWNDNPKYWHIGDGAFWNRLNEFQQFYPINLFLDISYKLPNSFQNLNIGLPEKIPEGILIKGLSPEVYLLENQKRRLITNDMFHRLKYRSNQIVEIPDPVIFKYPLGPPIDQNIFYENSFPNYRLVKIDNHSEIYYIQNNQKRHFFNLEAFQKFHFNLEDTILLDEKQIINIPDGPLINSTITTNTLLPNGVIFKMDYFYFFSNDNFLHPIHSTVLKKLKLHLQRPVLLTEKEFFYFKKGDEIIHKY